MADQTQGETPTPEASETPATTAQPTPAELAAKLDEVQKALKAANRESADRRKKLEEFEKAEAERKQAEMTEAQKLQAKLEAIQAEKDKAIARANTALVRAAILTKAAGKFHDPEDAVGALVGKLTVNDAGEVEGVDEALKELEKVKPHWLKKANPQLGATNPGQNGSGAGETDAQRRRRLIG